MPPLGGLGDADIAAIVTYVKGHWGTQAEPITADEVKRVRDAGPAPAATTKK